MSSEREFIRHLKQRFPVRFPVEVGIGDDGAVINSEGQSQQVIVTDLLLDGVHFDLAKISPELAGRKAIAVNLSDLAAMACRPTAAFVSIAIPRNLHSADAFLASLYDGIEELANRYEFTIAGGDTNAWNGPFAINVCLTGVPFSKTIVLRCGAKPGDSLYVTGPLGGSLHSGRHLTFEPRLEMSRWLVNNMDLHAMMDISDGVSIDLNRMMEASGTGATIDATSIPIHHDVAESSSADLRLANALSNGEDFELLFATAGLPDNAKLPHGATLTKIGEVTDHANHCLIKHANGATSPLSESGWQHI